MSRWFPTPLLLVSLFLVSLLLGGCGSSAPTPTFEPLRAAAQRRPVVMVPGITGSRLRDRGTGKLAWGSGVRLLAPHDGAYGFARSLNDPAAGTDLEADGVLEEIRMLGISKPIYGPIPEALEAHGYRRGDLGAPGPADTVFLFDYDWRQDNEIAIRRLAEALERLRIARGEDRLAVDLICQSNGAHICRYLAKYGDATFEESAAGQALPPENLEIGKLILIGTSNGGSLRILREVDRGRRYVSLGRKMQPEALFTFSSLYQDLPSYLDRYFLDEDGQELDLDLYDAENWERYGWSIFGAKARRRVARRPDLFGGPADWKTFLEGALERAQLLHRLLIVDPPGFTPPRYYLIQNADDPTPERAVLKRKTGRRAKGGWELLFTGDDKLKRQDSLHAKASTKGDGHASLESQRHLSPLETAAIAAEPFHVTGDHFELILQPESLERLLRYLHE